MLGPFLLMDLMQNQRVFCANTRWRRRSNTRPYTQGGLTQLVEVRVAAVGSWHRADQTGLEECGPLVDQTPLAAHVILTGNTTRLVLHHFTRLDEPQPRSTGLL